MILHPESAYHLYFIRQPSDYVRTAGSPTVAPTLLTDLHDNQPTSAKCLEVEVETWREVLFFHQIAWHPKVRDRSRDRDRDRERKR